MNAIPTETQDLLKSFKGLEKVEINQSSKYYSEYGAKWTSEKIAWLLDMILNMCDDALRNKLRDGLVGVSPLKSSDPLVLKLMLDIIIDINETNLHALT